MSFSKKAFLNILIDISINFFFGLIVFLLLLVMIQTFSLSEDIINFGADTKTILQILFYISLSFLPIIIPMSFLFAVLMTFSRLNMESELIALKSLGLSHVFLFLAPFLFSIFCVFVSSNLSFHIAPWGQKKIAEIFKNLAQDRIKLNIKEGIFTTQFRNIVIYANKISNDSTKLSQLFIYSRAIKNEPITLTAQNGRIETSKNKDGSYGHIKLTDGHIHQSNHNAHTKVSFAENIVNLYDPVQATFGKKNIMSLSLTDLKSKLTNKDTKKKDLLKANIEISKRWALSFANIFFAFIGFGVATLVQRRQSKSNGLVVCVGLIVLYWVLFISSENLAKTEKLPVLTSIWFPNFLFAITGLWFFKRSTQV